MNADQPQRNRRILVIDDNPSIHGDFRKILVNAESATELHSAAAAFFGEEEKSVSSVQIELESATQGEEGVRKAADAVTSGRPFAMAFVDMRMPPGWDGLKTISELWKVDPEIQVVICSAYSDRSWSEIQETLGETDKLLILKKPFDNAEVLQLAMSMIEKRHLLEVAQSKTDALETLVEERTRDFREAKEESERLISSIDSILIGVNESGKVERWNPRAEQLFGLTVDEVIGQPFDTLPIHWNEPLPLSEMASSKSASHEVSFEDADGQRKFVSLSTYPIIHDAQAVGTLILGADLTEHHMLENQLQQAQKLESVGQLAAGVAHEINTPMQYIGDNLDFLEKKVSSIGPILDSLVLLMKEEHAEEDRQIILREMLEAAKKSKVKKFNTATLDAITDSKDGVKHVSKIVRAMKEFAHPGQEERTPVDINRALESTIAVSTNEWKYVANVEKELDPSIPTVNALSVELNQVFLNIIVNAAHAIGGAEGEDTVELGTITVSTSLVNDNVQIAISDTGSGIPDNIKKRIFDPFFTTKEVGKGTGQGLSIAHNVIVGQHGGRLWCDSTPGKGTTFFIQIPSIEHDTDAAVGQTESELAAIV